MSGDLITEPNLPDPDAVYRLIAEAHRTLSEVESAALNARLVLIFANHIGEAEILRQALALAHEAR